MWESPQRRRRGRALLLPRGFVFAPAGRAGDGVAAVGCADARRFGRLFAGLTAGGVALLVGTNWLVNPWRLYSPALLPPRVLDIRDDRCTLLWRASLKPEQLVLGSSRMFCWEPAVLERRTGLRTFNASVTDAKPMDALALYRYAADTLRAPVWSVLIGVETQTFVNVAASYRVLATHPHLRRCGRRCGRSGGAQGSSAMSSERSPRRGDSAESTARASSTSTSPPASAPIPPSSTTRSTPPPSRPAG